MTYTDYKICPNCGNGYHNFCLRCATAARDEEVENLMKKYGLNVETVIAELASHVFDEKSLAAVKEAITLLRMRPATKTDITSGGKPLDTEMNSARNRLADRISRISARKSKKEDS